MKHSRAEVAASWIKNKGNPAKVIEAVAVAEAESALDDSASTWCCHGVWALHTMHTPVSCSTNLDCATKRAIEISQNGKSWAAWDVHPDSDGRTGWSGGADWWDETLAKVKGDKQLQKFLKSDSQFVGLFDDPLGLGIDIFGGGGDEITGSAGAGALPGVGDVLAPIVEPIEGIARFFIGAGELLFTPEGWKRVGFLAGGSVLLLIGLNSVMKSGYGVDAGGTVKKAAAVAATKGAVK